MDQVIVIAPCDKADHMDDYNFPKIHLKDTLPIFNHLFFSHLH